MEQKKLNQGYVFQYPFESYYAMVRRFIVANKGQTMPTIFGGLSSQAAIKIRNMGQLARQISTKSLPQVSKSELNDCGLFGLNYIGRHCPVCAQIGYHTYLFECNWLTFCPVHHEKLIVRCPKCHEYWPNLSQIIYRNCSGCGNRIQLEQTEERFIDSDKEEMFLVIGKLEKTVKQNLLDDIKPLLIDKPTSIMREIEPTNGNFIFHLYAQYPATYDEEIKISGNKIPNLCSKSFKCVPLDALPKTVPRKNLPSWTAACRFNVLREISSVLNSISKHNHKVLVTNYNEVPIEFLSTDNTFCPYCFAVSCWFNKVISFSSNHPQTYTSNGFNFYVKGYDSLPQPEPIRFIKINENTYEVDDDFEIWSYETQLEQLFILLLGLITSFCDDKGEIVHASSFTSNIMQLDSASFASHSYKFDNANYHIKVTYPSLEDALHQFAVKNENKGSNCESFHKYLDLCISRPSQTEVAPHIFMSVNQLKFLEFGGPN